MYASSLPRLKRVPRFAWSPQYTQSKAQHFMRIFDPDRNQIHVSRPETLKPVSAVKVDHSCRSPPFPEALARLDIHVLHGGKSQHRAAQPGSRRGVKPWRAGRQSKAAQVLAQKAHAPQPRGTLIAWGRQSGCGAACLYLLLTRGLPSGHLLRRCKLCGSVIRNSALGSNYVIAIIRGRSSP